MPAQRNVINQALLHAANIVQAVRDHCAESDLAEDPQHKLQALIDEWDEIWASVTEGLTE